MSMSRDMLLNNQLDEIIEFIKVGDIETTLIKINEIRNTFKLSSLLESLATDRVLLRDYFSRINNVQITNDFKDKDDFDSKTECFFEGMVEYGFPSSHEHHHFALLYTVAVLTTEEDKDDEFAKIASSLEDRETIILSLENLREDILKQNDYIDKFLNRSDISIKINEIFDNMVGTL